MTNRLTLHKPDWSFARHVIMTLERHLPGKPWTLRAGRPGQDVASALTKTFPAHDWRSAEPWIATQVAAGNVVECDEPERRSLELPYARLVADLLVVRLTAECTDQWTLRAHRPQDGTIESERHWRPGCYDQKSRLQDVWLPRGKPIATRTFDTSKSGASRAAHAWIVEHVARGHIVCFTAFDPSGDDEEVSKNAELYVDDVL
jgi:hypothetical protein